MLDLMKQLLGIADDSKDIVLNHHLEKSILAIKKYCNMDNIPEEHNTSVVDLAIYFYKNRNDLGVTQQSQGSRSRTLEKGIPEAIRASLPTPKIKVVG